jgi:hypothetical protein
MQVSNSNGCGSSSCCGHGILITHGMGRLIVSAIGRTVNDVILYPNRKVWRCRQDKPSMRNVLYILLSKPPVSRIQWNIDILSGDKGKWKAGAVINARTQIPLKPLQSTQLYYLYIPVIADCPLKLRRTWPAKGKEPNNYLETPNDTDHILF